MLEIQTVWLALRFSWNGKVIGFIGLPWFLIPGLQSLYNWLNNAVEDL